MPVRLSLTPEFFNLFRESPEEKARKRNEVERTALARDLAQSFQPTQQPDYGLPVGAGMSRPVQSPEFAGRFLGQGGTPGQLIDLIRSLEPADRDVVQDELEAATKRVLRGETITQQPEILRGLLYDRFKIKVPETPEAVGLPKTFAGAVIGGPGAFGDDQAAYNAFMERYRQYQAVGRAPETAEMRADLTTPQALNELQQTAKARLKALEDQRYETATSVDFPNPSDAVKAGFSTAYDSASGQDYYYRERPEITDQIRELTDWLGSLGAQLQSADSLRATRTPGAPSEAERMVRELQTAGIAYENGQPVTADNPRLAEIYQRYLEWANRANR